MENNTSAAPACSQQPYDAGIGEKVGRTVALSFIMSLAFVGNLLVLLVFKRNPTTRTNTNYFIVNMAASDMLYPFFLLPRQTVYTWLGFRRFLIGGQVGEFLCKLAPLTVDISTAVSIQSLVLIAVERFIAVVYPLKAKSFTSRRRAVLIIATWIVATVLHLPHFYIYRLETRCNTLYCRKHWTPLFDTETANEVYDTILSVVLVYIPFLLIAVLYTSLSLKLRRMKAPGSQVGNTPQEIRRRERNRRITNMSICIVIVFAVCWLPLAIYMTM